MNNLRGIIGTIVCLVIGGYFLIKGMGLVVQDFQSGENYNEMSATAVTQNKLVEGNIVYVMDCIQEETLSRFGRSGGITLSRIYLIPVGEEQFMGIRVDGTQCSKMDQMVENTWDYINGNVTQLENSLKAKGKIKAFEQAEMRYAYDYMKAALGVDTDAECDPYLVPYYMDCRYYGKAYIPFLIAVILLGMVFNAFRKRNRGKAIDYSPYEEDFVSNEPEEFEMTKTEAPKEPIMREDPFEAARQEQAESAAALDDKEKPPATESAFKLRLKDD